MHYFIMTGLGTKEAMCLDHVVTSGSASSQEVAEYFAMTEHEVVAVFDSLVKRGWIAIEIKEGHEPQYVLKRTRSEIFHDLIRAQIDQIEKCKLEVSQFHEINKTGDLVI